MLVALLLIFLFFLMSTITVSIIAKLLRGSLVYSIKEVTKGSKRKISPSEQKSLIKFHQSMGKTPWKLYQYRYVITEPYELQVYTSDGKDIKRTIIVPVGAIFDGDTAVSVLYGKDTKFNLQNNAWVYHDYLYRTHLFIDGSVCSRKLADDIMVLYLKQYDKLSIYGFIMGSMRWVVASTLKMNYNNSFLDGAAQLTIPKVNNGTFL